MFEIIEKLIQNTFVASVLVISTLLYAIYVCNKYTKKPLRVILFLVGVLMIVFRTPPGTEVNIEGFAIITTLLIPVVVIMILMILLLDTLMAKVMQDEAQEVSRYQYAIKFNLAIVFIMCVEWIPYFNAI